MNCEECGLLEERAKLAEARTSAAIAEAYQYRRLWEAGASCLAKNAAKIKPRGEDERKILELAKGADHGVFWSGETKGWI